MVGVALRVEHLQLILQSGLALLYSVEGQLDAVLDHVQAEVAPASPVSAPKKREVPSSPLAPLPAVVLAAVAAAACGQRQCSHRDRSEDAQLWL